MLPDEPVILPMYKQYLSIKEKHPECVILIGLDDLYETYCEDAVSVSEILGIPITRHFYNKGNPEYAEVDATVFRKCFLDSYLPMLIKAKKRVAICESVLTND